jgi:hypothetical protein
MNRATPPVLAALLVLSSLAILPGAQAAPAIGSVSPTSGQTNGGTLLNITGSGFAVGAVVQLTDGGSLLTLTGLRVTGNSITGTTPASTHPGAFQVKVTNPDGSSSLAGTSFTYTASAVPAITSITPTNGPSTGSTPEKPAVVVSGTGFSTALKPRVTIAGVLATVQSATATSLIVVPSAGTGNGAVVVTNPDGSQATSSDLYTYTLAPGPTISSIVPLTGSANGGVTVTITGSNFAPGATVKFGTGATVKAATSVGYVSPTQIRVVTPPQSLGANPPPENVQVTNPDGQQATLPSAYTVTPGPSGANFKVTSVSPAQGPSSGGTPITVGGIGFVAGPGLGVRVGGVDATNVQFVSETQVKAVTPLCANPCTDPAKGDIVVVNPDNTPSQPLSKPCTDASIALSNCQNLFKYAGQVVITGVQRQPGGGSLVDTSGTQPIAITGSGFSTDSCAVYIGGVKATVTSCGSGTIAAIPPAGPAGTKDVQVVNSNGRTATLQAGIGYTLPALPQVTQDASTGNGKTISANGGEVTLTGTGFIPVLGEGDKLGTCTSPVVTFGNAVAIVTQCSPTTLKVQVPPVANSALAVNPLSCGNSATPCLNIAVKVTNIDGQSGSRNAALRYTQAAAPVYSDPCLPDPCETSITDGGTLFTLNSLDDASGGARGFVPGVVINGVRYFATTVKVGSSFATITDIPNNNGKFNQIKAIAPAGTKGSAAVVVTNPDGQSSDGKDPQDPTSDTVSNYFNYVKPDPPTITSLAIPQGGTSANGNTLVALNGGVVFGPGATVYFDQTPVAIRFPEPCGTNGVTENCVDGSSGPGSAGNTIKVRTPGHAPGTVSVKVVNRDGQAFTLANSYTYQPGNAPTVTGVSPGTASGIGGNVIQILGTGFADGSQSNSDKLDTSYLKPTVTIGGVVIDKANVTVLDAANCVSGTSKCIRVVLPSHTPGAAAIKVQNPDGQESSLTGAFRFLGTQTGVTIVPNAGSQNGGSFIGLAGKGFDPASQAPVVLFGPTVVDATIATGSAVASGTLAVATTPQGPSVGGTLISGPTNVFLVDLEGQTLTLPNGFTYTNAVPPSFTLVSPAATQVNGGQLTTLKGSGFAPGSRICLSTVDPLPADATCVLGSPTQVTAVQYVDSQTLKFVTPSGVPGPVDILVTNPAGGAANTLVVSKDRSLFTYSPAPSPIITSMNPTSGDVVGGTVVTLSGANFASGTQVLFDTTPATNVTVASANTITARAPEHDTGPVFVTVVAPGGLSYSFSSPYTYTGNSTGNPTNTTTGTTTTDTTTTTTTTGGSTTTTTTTSGQPATLTEDQIISANKDVSVTVTRDGGDNLVSFTLPLNLPATAQGVQVFRSNSPFVLVATLDRTSTDFQSRSYLDVGAPLASKYLVTVFYANGQGKATSSPDEIPGFSQLGPGVQSGDANNAQLTLIGYLLVGVLAVFLVVLLIVLVVRGRRPPAQPTAPPPAAEGAPAEGAGAPGDESLRHSVNCPNCGSIFEAVGPKPLRMECPTCGKAGVLR